MASEFFTDEHTEILQKLVREVVNDPSTYMGSKFLPSVALPVNKIRVEVVEASGGLTNAHVPGTDPKYIEDFGTRVQEFIPPKWKEAIHWDEERILYLRELGQNDRSKRGIRQYIDIAVDKLNRRLEARIEKLRWDAIFDGGYSWFGKTVSFGIPAANLATPIGAVWSTGGPTPIANDAAEPLEDIRYWTMGGLAPYRKYKVSKMYMNPNTARFILDNANVQSLVSRYFSNDVFGKYELNKTLQLLIPGSPEVVIYDGWYQSESLVGGKVTVSDAIYFIPDGKIFFEVSNLPGGDVIGEWVQSVHLAEGTIDNPGYGKFLVVDDNTTPGSKGGPKNPFVDLVAGVYGGPKLDRPFDVLTADVL